MGVVQTEARITTAKNVLLLLSSGARTEWVDDFCGVVVDDPGDLPDVSDKSVYLVGDVDEMVTRFTKLDHASRVFVVAGDPVTTIPEGWSNIGAGMVPLLRGGAGVFYRQMFSPKVDHFAAVTGQHTFQSLTESTKPSKALRSGLYLTPVERRGDDLHFRLLRCSTNLSGPTAGFSPIDAGIVEVLNKEASFIFEDQAPLNHVLAQIYPNAVDATTRKQTKAKIQAHADKTKDMPANGIMAFCTFYDQLDDLKPLTADPYDLGHKTTSGMTRLEFRLKESVADARPTGLLERFSVTLYPNSVFFMPLSTNRLYTHAIRPAGLDASQLPTRLGYVVRCSATEAVHRHGSTFLKTDRGPTELQPPTPEGIEELRRLYADENRTDAFIDYGARFDFSMNAGDYDAPSLG